MLISDLLSGNTSFGSLNKSAGVTISNGPEAVEVSIDMPGFDKKDIKISGDRGYLTIVAKNEFRQKTLEVLVGAEVNFSEARASVKNGVLNVSLARVATQPKRIEIA